MALKVISMPNSARERPQSAVQKKSLLGTLVRAVVSVALAGFVYLTVDRKGLFHALRAVSLHGVLLILVLYTIGQILSALKWRIFVRSAGIERSLVQMLRAYFFGMFVNVIGFGTVGGDVARGLLLMPAKGQRAAALATVVADRVHGLGILLSIGTIAILVVSPSALSAINIFLALGGIAGVICVASVWWFGPPLVTKLFPSGHNWSAAMIRVAHAFPRTPKPFCAATLISILFHSVQLFMHVIIARLLGAHLPVSYIFATVPFVNIVASLPISLFNGLGVRESMYCILFIPAGIPKEVAVAFGAIWLFNVTLVSSLGILFLTPDMKKVIRREHDAEAGLALEDGTSSPPERALG